MADRGHHGRGQHDKRHVAVPPVPGTGLVVVEAEFILGSLKAVLDRPSAALDPDQRLDRGAGGTLGGKECQLAIGHVATDQQTAGPTAG